MIARSGGIYRRRSAALFDENVRIEARQIRVISARSSRIPILQAGR